YSSSVSSNPEFVTLMYRLLLNRAPDEAGLVNYTARLRRGSMSRSTLRKEIIGSDEFKMKHSFLFPGKPPTTASNLSPPPLSRGDALRKCDLRALAHLDGPPANQVSYSFCLVLGRAVDGVGLARFSEAHQNGTTIPERLFELSVSDEFQRKYSASKMSNSEYVTLLYNVLLDFE